MIDRTTLSILAFFGSIFFFIAWNEIVILPFQFRDLPPNYKQTPADTLYNQLVIIPAYLSMITGLLGAVHLMEIVAPEEMERDANRLEKGIKDWIRTFKAALGFAYRAIVDLFIHIF